MSTSGRTPKRADRGLAAVFAALGDSTRFSLVTRLSGGEARSIAELTEGTAMTRQAVTKHLGVLAGAGLVRAFRAGRERRYALESAPLGGARRALEEIEGQWERALGRLKRHVEGPG